MDERQWFQCCPFPDNSTILNGKHHCVIWVSLDTINRYCLHSLQFLYRHVCIAIVMFVLHCIALQSTFVQIVNMPLVRSTITIQNPSSTLPSTTAAMKHIYQTRGVSGLWHGVSAGILKVC